MILYYATVHTNTDRYSLFFSSEAKARSWCRTLTKSFALDAKKDTKVDQLEVPSDKAGLIGWLNQRYGFDPLPQPTV